jgi:hypothetical protein
MRPHALAIYQQLFPGCEVEDLRTDGGKVHILDREFGIDLLLTMESGQSITIQEKYREHDFLVNKQFQVEPPWPDFTQEYMNAAGTPHEAPGEWFHLAAQLYFYGWAARNKSGFAAWVMLDIPKYKVLVEQAGGLGRLGQLCANKKHGRANFYAIPINRLRRAWIASPSRKWLV